MVDKTQAIFPTLDRILRRCNVSKEMLPKDQLQWQDFISRLNNSYLDYEQERYLLERSMEISSREMLELNERLEIAQDIAHIGYWYYDRSENQILWSKETYRILGFDASLSPPAYEVSIQRIEEADREVLSKLVDRAFAEGIGYDLEVRINNDIDKQTHWAYLKGHPYKKKENASLYVLSGIIMDTTAQKIAQEEVKKLNEQLISIARKAGMSEIATSILHNVGNILNSVNVSITMIQETLQQSDIAKLIKALQMMNENLLDDPNYLTTHPKGKLIPNYLNDLSGNLLSEQNNVKKEISNLVQGVNHIKDIVRMQKDISGITGMNEKVILPEVVDLAIQMSCAIPEKYGISIIKQYQYDKIFITDKSKLLQILVNLIQNAKDSLELQKPNQKTIDISVKKQKNQPNVEIIIEDNGLGINKNNLLKIFSMGFTTKATGHGFGLHSCALAANELGGSLEAHSEGEGLGASFVLTLPIQDEMKIKDGKENIHHAAR